VRGPAAYQRFSGLKKDVRTIATDQIRRLERAMVAQRRWTGAEFRDLFVAHPVLWHIVRRLVWAVYEDAGAREDGAQAGESVLRTAFRVAEDRSFATVDDDTFELADDDAVGLVHPAAPGRGGDRVGRGVRRLRDPANRSRSWDARFYRLTDDERGAVALHRFGGVKFPTTRVFGLEHRGWRRGDPQDAGVQGWIERALPDGRTIVAELEPGIIVGVPDDWPQQQITKVWLNPKRDGSWRGDNGLPLGRLDAVDASELLRDLTEVTNA